MALKRMDNIGIVVDDLEATITFFQSQWTRTGVNEHRENDQVFASFASH
jgi:hypothetical protein